VVFAIGGQWLPGVCLARLGSTCNIFTSDSAGFSRSHCVRYRFAYLFTYLLLFVLQTTVSVVSRSMQWKDNLTVNSAIWYALHRCADLLCTLTFFVGHFKSNCVSCRNVASWLGGSVAVGWIHSLKVVSSTAGRTTAS